MINHLTGKSTSNASILGNNTTIKNWVGRVGKTNGLLILVKKT